MSTAATKTRALVGVAGRTIRVSIRSFVFPEARGREQLGILFLLIGSTFAALGRVQAPLAEIGTSKQFRNDDGLGNYNFGYDEDHTSGGSFRRETGNALGAKEGSYGLRDADGRVRVVSYIADELGFRASISSNEPGIMPSTPAGVTISLPLQRPVTPAVPLAAPAPAGLAPLAAVAFNTAPTRRPAYTPQEPEGTFFLGAPSPPWNQVGDRGTTVVRYRAYKKK
ncbi:hypothetical protein MRX96_004983 [Rhipicephalus microplus]